MSAEPAPGREKGPRTVRVDGSSDGREIALAINGLVRLVVDQAAKIAALEARILELEGS